MIIKYLIEKEFKQIARNSFLPRLIVAFPCLVMLVLPWAVNLEIKNINLAVVDHDRSSLSGRLTGKIEASDYFNLVSAPGSWESAMREIESGKADIILEIPFRFEQSWTRQERTDVMIAANAVNGTKGGLGSVYLSSVVADFAGDLREEAGMGEEVGIMPGFEVIPNYRFNPNLDYKAFMVPALMVMLLTMLCGFLPALNIVGEKEAGTIEQINVTPVSKFNFILAKLIPYWLIGFVILTICFGIARGVYGLIPVGSLLTIYCFAMFFVLVVSGFGLVISNYSSTMQQAMFVMFFFVIVMLLMSGLFTPINTMPQWAQAITVFNPLKYFIQVMRQVYLKGSAFSELTSQFIALGGFALFFNLWAVFSYRKHS